MNPDPAFPLRPITKAPRVLSSSRHLGFSAEATRRRGRPREIPPRGPLRTPRHVTPIGTGQFPRSHWATSPTPKIILAVRLCRVKQLPPSRPTGFAPRRLGTVPPLLFYVEDLYLLQYFPRLSLPPSGLRIGRVLRRFDRVHTVVQPLGLTVELPSTTHGPSSSRTWIGRTPDELYSAHPRVYGGDARDGFLLGCSSSLFPSY